MCRVAGKAFYERGLEANQQVTIMSMHDQKDDADDNRYFPSEIFEGFAARKLAFVKKAVQKGSGCNVVILSHINLLLVGWLIKKVSPETKIYLFAHGIEIWETLKTTRKNMLPCCDVFLCVSRYTKKVIIASNRIDPSRCVVLNNCIDPFLPLPQQQHTESDILNQYGVGREHIVLFTLTRLSSKDRYKGYDKVFEALALIKDIYPNIRYLLGGGYDAVEKDYVQKEILRLGLSNIVIVTGYLPEEHLASYFAMADIYIMPSKKEGFGLVFIEAMFYGLPVIAGNADGSVDALLNGKLGLLVNPESVEEIKTAIKKMIQHPEAFVPERKVLMDNFSYPAYKRNLDEVLGGQYKMIDNK